MSHPDFASYPTLRKIAIGALKRNVREKFQEFFRKIQKTTKKTQRGHQ